MRYKIKVKQFSEKARTLPLGECTEEEALDQYDAMKISLSLGGGGYLQLFEGNGKYPIKAERVGYERYAYVEEVEEEYRDEHEPLTRPGY
jgi:hypothetical protein